MKREEGKDAIDESKGKERSRKEEIHRGRKGARKEHNTASQNNLIIMCSSSTPPK